MSEHPKIPPHIVAEIMRLWQDAMNEETEEE